MGDLLSSLMSLASFLNLSGGQVLKDGRLVVGVYVVILVSSDESMMCIVE